jgi:hypothetical protein
MTGAATPIWRALNATDSRIDSQLPPTVAWKNGGSGLMFCDRAAP